MATLMKKMNLSSSYLPEFGNFVVTLFKNRIFLLFLALDVVLLFVEFFTPEFSLPQIYYFGFILIGIIWASFQIYRDLSSAYQNESSISAEKITKSELSLSFANGKEYIYSISDPYAGQNLYITRMQKTRGVKCRFDERGVLFINAEVFYVMGKGSLDINIRIENSGDLPLDILNIDLENNLDLRHLLMFNDDIFLNGNRLRFPFHLKQGEFTVLQLKSKICLSKGSNNPLFAADLRSLPKSILHEVTFDTMDVDKKRQTYVSSIEIPSQPLIDLYVKQWREYEQEEYLVLAGYSL